MNVCKWTTSVQRNYGAGDCGNTMAMMTGRRTMIALIASVQRAAALLIVKRSVIQRAVVCSTSTSARPISAVNPQTARRWSCIFSLWERCFPQPKISGFPSRLASTPWAVCLLYCFVLLERGGRWLADRCAGRSVELFIVFPSCSRHCFART